MKLFHNKNDGADTATSADGIVLYLPYSIPLMLSASLGSSKFQF